MALTRRMRKKIMKSIAIGYVSVFILATTVCWILGSMTGQETSLNPGTGIPGLLMSERLEFSR